MVRVRQALQRAGGGLRLGPVKTDGSIRFVAFLPVRAGAAGSSSTPGARTRDAGDHWVETGLVFTTIDGFPAGPANVNKAFAELSAEAGVRRIRFHDLRHSCATLLYELGVPIENIQDVLGTRRR